MKKVARSMLWVMVVVAWMIMSPQSSKASGLRFRFTTGEERPPLMLGDPDDGSGNVNQRSGFLTLLVFRLWNGQVIVIDLASSGGIFTKSNGGTN